MPTTDDPFLTAGNLLPDLHDALKAHKRVVLTGIGGIGKTTLANEYAKRYVGSGYYKAFLFVDAQSEETLLAQFCASILDPEHLLSSTESGHSEPDKRNGKINQAKLRDDFLNRLAGGEMSSARHPFLLIFHGIDQGAEYIKPYYDPGATTYHVLITSRDDDFDETIAARFPVPLMPEKIAVELLFRYAGKTDEQMQALDQKEQQAAYELAVHKAGRLPLALRAIGKACHSKECTSLADFLTLHNKDTDRLKKTYGYDEEYKKTTQLPTEDKLHIHPDLYPTFRVCLNLATDPQKHKHELAEATKDLAYLIAVLAPDILPERWLDSAARTGLLGDRVRSLSSHNLTVKDAIRIMDDVGLLQWVVAGNDNSHVSMHNAVQTVIKFDMGDAAHQQAEEQSKQFVDWALGEVYRGNDLHGIATLFPHAVVCCNLEADTSRFENLEIFRADLKVQNALANGDWSIVFTEPGEDEPTYSTFRNMESPEWQQRMRRIIASLDRAVPDVVARRRCFACIYFLAHYWWDCYLEERDTQSLYLVEPLVKAWEARYTDQTDKEFVAALREFRKHYPHVRNYKGRGEKVAAWGEVYKALAKIGSSLNINISNVVPEQEEPFTPSEKYLYGILSLHVAEALRYVDKKQYYGRGEQSKLWNIYAQAEELFKENEDAFDLSWTLWEEAEARREAADYLNNSRDWFGRHGDGAALYVAAERKAEEALRLAAKLPAVQTVPAAKEYESDLDAELLANAYRTLADIRWANTNRSNVAWGYYCAAILAAYAFMESQEDEYSRQLYEEQVERLLDRLLELPTNSDNDRINAVLVCRFLQNFWIEYWKSHVLPIPDFQPALEAGDREGLKRSLFPWTPTPADIKNPDSPCRRCLAGVLEIAPEIVAGMHPLLKPILLTEVSILLRNDSRGVNAQFAEWVLDEEKQLNLRKVRRDDIDLLAALSADAFGNNHDGELVHAMLTTHCNTARTIPLNAVEHTMMPTQYYVLTLAGTIIGLSGLYRIVWADKAVFSLGWFFVAPAYQRRKFVDVTDNPRPKFGERLLMATMQIAKKHGGTRLMIETEPGLTAALSLYKKLGFEQVGTVANYYAKNSDLLLVTRELNSIPDAEDMPDGLKDVPLYNS